MAITITLYALIFFVLLAYKHASVNQNIPDHLTFTHVKGLLSATSLFVKVIYLNKIKEKVKKKITIKASPIALN
jgi:hypothetical protein